MPITKFELLEGLACADPSSYYSFPFKNYYPLETSMKEGFCPESKNIKSPFDPRYIKLDYFNITELDLFESNGVIERLNSLRIHGYSPYYNDQKLRYSY